MGSLFFINNYCFSENVSTDAFLYLDASPKIPLDVTIQDCNKASFNISMASCGQSINLCLSGSSTNPLQNWKIVQGGVTINLTGINPCTNLNPSNGNLITVTNYISILGQVYSCTKSFSIDCHPDCESLSFSLDTLFCHGTFTLDSGPPSSNIFWNFGDGTPIGTSTEATVNHKFPDIGGTYNVCLTQTINGVVKTCCKEVTVSPCGPTPCDNMLLKDDVLSYNDETGDLEVKYTLLSSEDIYGYEWDFGDNTPIVTTTGNMVTHIFENADCYDICVTIILRDGTRITCCFNKKYDACNCCDTADFTAAQLYVDCIQNQFVIEPDCTISNDDVKHTWIFSDGSPDYHGVFPFTHTFTNFVTETGDVWITHIVTCGKYELKMTKHFHIKPGAYLGKLNEITKTRSKIHWPAHPADIYVDDFIQEFSQNPLVPLMINGTLHVNGSYTWHNGVWNMGLLSRIFVKGEETPILLTYNGTPPSIDCNLDGTTIQDAARIGLLFCCRWVGFQNEGPNQFHWTNATISDAIVMWDVLAGNSDKNIPTIYFTNCLFLENNTGIRTIGNYFQVAAMSNNEFRGPYNCNIPDVGVCDCYVQNAIDIRYIYGKGIIFPLNASANNIIKYYENGLYCYNATVNFRSFEIMNGIYNVDQPLTTNNGIYVVGRKANNSYSQDRIYVHDVLRGAKFVLSDSYYKINSVASTNLESIVFDNVAKGIDISSSLGYLDGIIQGNMITTNGTSSNGGYMEENRGLKLSFSGSAFNKFSIISNMVNSNAASQIGIYAASNVEMPQTLLIDDNTISAASSGNNGAGMYVGMIDKSYIINNRVSSTSSIKGIEMANCSNGYVKCNDVTHGDLGLDMSNAKANMIYNNYLHTNDINNLKFTNDCMGIGTGIFSNTFKISEYGPDVTYKNGITGAQIHSYYNNWLNQEPPNEVYQPVSGNVKYTKFARPSNAVVGSLHYPKASPISMMVSAGVQPYPQALGCGVGDAPNHNFDNGGLFDNPTPPDERYNEIVSDTNAYIGLSDAERDGLKQSIMDEMLEHSTWSTNNVALATFQSNESIGFIGKSTNLRHAMSGFESNINAQHIALIALQDSVTALQTQVSDLYAAMLLETDTIVLASLQLQANALIANINNLQNLISTQQTTNAGINQAALNTLNLANTAMLTSGQHQLNEQWVNDYTLKTWSGIALTQSEKDNLLNIAQTCYHDGGRAVYFARELSNSLFDTYYTEEGCGSQNQNQQRSSNSEEAKGVSISPNPVSQEFNISLDNSYIGKTILYRLFGANGKQELSLKTDNFKGGKITVNVSKLPSGLYILHLNSGENTINLKLVIERN